MNTNEPFVFISYHTQSTLPFVEALAEELDAFGVRTWYAKRDISEMENYINAVYDVIPKCGLFLLLFNKGAATSKDVENECQIAWNTKKDRIMLARLEDYPLSKVVEYLASYNQFLDVSDCSNEVAIKIIATAVSKYMSKNADKQNTEIPLQAEHKNNDLEFYGHEYERERIQTQRQILRRFAWDTYREVIESFSSPTILDVGCHTGEQFMLYTKPTDQYRYVGIDRETAALEYGRKLFSEQNCVFYELNVTEKGFRDRLDEIEKECGIDGFDIINVSMVLLHVSDPRRLINDLREHLSDGGKIIVVDIDDGFNMAYPDPKGYFQRAIGICEYDEFAGYRKMGREIYRYLKETEMESIELRKIGVSTVSMDRKTRRSLFDIYFSFIYDDLKLMQQKYPSSQIISTDIEWLQTHLDEMRLDFMESSFFFTLGFVLYVAG